MECYINYKLYRRLRMLKKNTRATKSLSKMYHFKLCVKGIKSLRDECYTHRKREHFGCPNYIVTTAKNFIQSIINRKKATGHPICPIAIGFVSTWQMIFNGEELRFKLNSLRSARFFGN